MLQYLKADDSGKLTIRENLVKGSWIRCERPNEEEISQLLSLGIDADIITDALDPHEVPR